MNVITGAKKIRPRAGPAASRNRTTLYMFLAANVSLLRMDDLHAKCRLVRVNRSPSGNMFCGLQPHRERAKQCINDAAGGLTRRKDLIEPRDGYFTSPQELPLLAPSRVGSFIRACAPADLNNEPSFSALAPEGGLFVEESFLHPSPLTPLLPHSFSKSICGPRRGTVPPRGRGGRCAA